MALGLARGGIMDRAAGDTTQEFLPAQNYHRLIHSDPGSVNCIPPCFVQTDLSLSEQFQSVSCDASVSAPP